MMPYDNKYNEDMPEDAGQSSADGEQNLTDEDTQPGHAAESQAVAEAGPKNDATMGINGDAAAAADDRYIRLMADFENFRKRTQREIEAGRRGGARALALDLLPALDALERGLDTAAAAGHSQDWLDGMTALRAMLLDALRRHGIVPMEAAGQPFDPERHEAMAVVNAPGQPSHHVYDIVRAGYMIGDEVLRPAQVRVTP